MPAALWRQATPHNHRVLAVGWDRGADRASNDADVSSIPPIIPYGGFSPVRLEGWRFGRRLPNASLSSSLLPAYTDHVLVCFRPSCIPSYPRMSRSVSGRLRADAPPWRVGNPPPQGSSLESGLCCPGLSSLNRPHPPHSRAHHDFAARRLIRNAFAVRERLGDPRVVLELLLKQIKTVEAARTRCWRWNKRPS